MVPRTTAPTAEPRKEALDLPEGGDVKKALSITLLLLLMAFSVSGQQGERQVNLDPGWNTVGLDVEGVHFSEDIRPECDFGWYSQQLADKDAEEVKESNRHYVWGQTGGEWTHPDYLNPAEGYSIYLDQDTSCSFTVDGQKADVESLTIQSGWNIVNVRSNSDVNEIWGQCGGREGLAWWSSLLDEGMDPGEIWDSDQYFFWINRGNDWRHPYQNSYSVQEADGAYVNGLDGCTVDLESQEDDGDGSDEPLVEEYLILEDASSDTREISRNQDLEVSLDISLNNDPEDVGARPTIALLKDGQREKEKTIDWDTNSVTFDWEDLWDSGEGEDQDADLDIVLDRNREGDYHWERQTASLGSHDIVRCGTGYVYSEFHDSNSGTEYDGCIEKNEDLETQTSDIEAETGWRLEAENSVIHVLESIGGEETSDGETLSIDTGEAGFCGRIYYENEYVGDSGEFTVEANMKTLGDSERTGWHQDPQEFFVEIDGEVVTSADIDHGESETFTHELDEGSTVRIGTGEEPNPPLFGCNSWDSRTSVEMDVEGEFDMPEYDRQNPFEQR